MGQYMISNDLTVLYCQDLRLKLSCKKLKTNEEGIFFEKYNGNLNLLDYYTDFSQEDVELFVNSIIKPKVGLELNKADMEWLEIFESVGLDNIKNDESLLFNYCLLKLKLLGMPEDMAIKIISTEFLNRHNIQDYPPIEILINKINSMLKNRLFWIPNDLNMFEKKEIAFFEKVFDYKSKLGYKFEFNIFKNNYISLIENSFIPYLIKYNSTKSYLVQSPINFLEQKDYILISYEFIISKILWEVMNNYDIKHSDVFLKDLMKELKLSIEFYFNVSAQKNKY